MISFPVHKRTTIHDHIIIGSCVNVHAGSVPPQLELVRNFRVFSTNSRICPSERRSLPRAASRADMTLSSTSPAVSEMGREPEFL